MYTSSSAVGGGAVGGAVGGAAGSLCYTEKPSSCEAFERRGYSTGVEFSGAPTSCSTHRSNVYFLPHQDISRCNSGIRIDTLCYTEPNALAFRGSVAHAASPGVIAQESRAPLQLSKTQCSQEPSQNTLPTSPSSEVQRKQSVTSWSTELVLSERAAVPSSLQQTRTPSPSSASSNRKALVRLRTLHWSAAGTPVASRWSRVSPQMRPWYTPSWVKEMQCKLPWYSATERAGGGPWLSWRASEVPYQFVKEEFLCRWRSWGDRCFLLFRALAVFLLILVLFLINVYPGMDLYDIKKVPQIYDLLQEWTAKLNCSIAELPIKGSVMIFIASLMMDAMVLVAWFQWIIIGDSFRLPIAYTLLYGIRGLMRIFSLLPYPDHYIWEAPDFKGVVIPSLTVPYQKSDDFFFSGHVGCGILVVSEHFYYRCWWGVVFSALVTLLQAFVMIVTRAHYTIDIFTGAVVASWVHMLSQSIALPIDQWCAFPPRPIPLRRNAEARTILKSDGNFDKSYTRKSEVDLQPAQQANATPIPV